MAAIEEGVASSRLPLEEEIDDFRFNKEGAPDRLVELSNSKTESDRLCVAYQPTLIAARVDISSKEEEGMDSKKKPSLKGLIANRNKGGTLKDVPKTQIPANLPPPPPLPADLGLHAT